MSILHNFWRTLPTPFFALAPMEDVTDAAFRRLIAFYGKPDVMFTEFTSADGLVCAPKNGQMHLRRKLLFSESERPIVAQIFSAIPDRMERAASIIAELGFDGIDINMGCPDRAIERGLCGAAMIQNPDLARAVIRAAKRGASGLPISVKTRIGYQSNELEYWLPTLLAEDLAAVTIHARTRNEMSDVPARWETIRQAVSIRDAIQRPRGDVSWTKTLIIGNGDVRDLADARTRVVETGCDGVMLGRAIYGNPWLFARADNSEHGRGHERTPAEKIEALIEHLHLFQELLGDVVHYATMKKHFKAYISGWDNAKALRVQLMETNTLQDALHVLTRTNTGHWNIM
jgi:nifR3 family TIM-barrel protein